MSLRWETPPPPRGVFNSDIIDELRSHPGRWALITERPYRINRATLKPPPADIETRFTYAGRTTRVWARRRTDA